MYASAGADSSYAPEFTPAIFIVREPVSRFKSLYANKSLNQGKRTEIEGHQDFFDTMPSVDQVIDYITTHDNPHWQPQVEQAHGYTHLLPMHLLSALIPTEPQNSTNSRNIPLTDAQIEKLEDFYYEDYHLYMCALDGELASILSPKA